MPYTLHPASPTFGVNAPVHLREDLIKSLLPLVVASGDPRTPLPPYSIDLVDENYAWRPGLCLEE